MSRRRQREHFNEFNVYGITDLVGQDEYFDFLQAQEEFCEQEHCFALFEMYVKMFARAYKMRAGAKQKFEQKIIANLIIDKDILTLQDGAGKNLGMYAVENGLEDVAILCLQNPVASLQQNKYFGQTIGMLCAIKKMSRATYVAMQNPKAVTIQDSFNWTIGMYASESGLEDAVSLVIDREDVLLQEDSWGECMATKAIKNLSEDVALKVVGFPKVLRSQNKWGISPAMMCAIRGFERASIIALGDPVASLQQEEYGLTLGMLCAVFKLHNAVEVALQNQEACRLQDEKGLTISTYCESWKEKA